MNINHIVIICILLALQSIPTLRAQQDVYSGLGAIPSAQTWYICSKQEANYINYVMKVVDTDQSPTPNFGINVQGNHPLQYSGILGLLTYATNFTGIQLFTDPRAKFSIYWPDLSCFEFPALECSREKNPPFPGKTILCLGISNPQDVDEKFILSISFVEGVPPPPLPTVSSKQTSTSSAPTAPTTSKTSSPNKDIPSNPPFFYATNNGLSNIININVIELLSIIVIILLSTIFILTHN